MSGFLWVVGVASLLETTLKVGFAVMTHSHQNRKGSSILAVKADLGQPCQFQVFRPASGDKIRIIHLPVA